MRADRLQGYGAAVAGALLAGGLAFSAFKSDGFTSDHLTLNDASVWVVRNGLELGRMNYELGKVDTKSKAGILGSVVDILQSDSTLVVQTTDRLIGYDVSLNEPMGQGNALPATARVAIGGENGAYLDTEGARFWFTDKTGVASIETTDGKVTEGSVELDGAERIIVGVDGIAHVIAPASNTMWTFSEAWGTGGPVAPAGAAVPQGPADTSVEDSGPDAPEAPPAAVGPDPTLLAGTKLAAVDLSPDDLQLTSVGDQAVFLSGRTLGTSLDRSFPLAPEVGDHAVLQLPGATADSVLVGSDSGLVAVSLDDGSVTVIHEYASSAAIAPVWLNGCSYAAWTDQVWSSCSSNQTAPRVSTSGAKFRINRNRVVLNYVDGTTDIFPDGEIRTIDNQWDDAFDPDQKTETEQSDQQEQQENKCEQQPTNSAPTIPTGLTFFARHGRSTKIDVLRPPVVDVVANDSDCDVLTVSVQPDQLIPPEQGVLSVIDDGRAFQFTPNGSESGAALSFGYQVSDGSPEGTVPGSASISVIAPDDPGSAPTANVDRTTVEVGKTVVIDVLANDWDPEGDALSVINASLPSANDGSLVWQSSGRFAFTAPGSGVGTKSIAYSVQDSFGQTSDSTLEVNVISAGVKSPPNALSDSLTGMLGGGDRKTFTVNVLANDSDPNGDPITLSEVAAYPTETTKAVKDSSGNVSISPDVPGSYNFVYKIADATGETAEGRVRFDIVEDQGAVAPVAVSDSAVVNTERPVAIDVLANDTDLNGDLLMITDAVLPNDVQSELNVEVLEHRVVRVSARTSVLSRKSYNFNYTVSDGQQTSTTTVNLGVASSSSQQPPVTIEDRAEVHLGGYVSLPVLANDFDPGGNPLSIVSVVLDPKVAEQGPPGLAFVQSSQIRYLAPAAEARGPFTVTGTYTVTNGRDTTNGRFVITVTDPRNGNRAPAPPPFEMRTMAGVPVTLELPSFGMDPDGDPVELVSLDAPLPTLGTATVSDDGSSITYTPLADRQGSDRFRFKLRDYADVGYLDVRVVIAGKPTGNRPPVAVTDTATVEAGKTTSLPLLANDTDPDSGDSISFAETPFDQPNDGAGTVADAGEGFVSYSAPSAEGDYAFRYYITDGDSSPVAGLVQVRVTAKNLLVNRPPKVTDVVLKPHRAGETVTIPLAGRATDPEGEPVSYGLGDDARALGVEFVDEPNNPHLTLMMGRVPMLFTFVADDGFPRDELARGVVQIPVPENRAPSASELSFEIAADESVKTIAIPDGTFSDPDGDPVKVYTESKPEVSPAEASNGGDMKWDGNSFLFNRNPDFGGSAKITYYIVDEPTLGDPIPVPATILLTVNRVVNTPPEVREDEVAVVSGSQVSYDLSQLVTEKDPEDQANLSYSNITFEGIPGVTMTQSGSRITLTADLKAVAEGDTKSAAITFTVDDGRENGSVSGRLRVTAQPTDLARPQAVDDLEPPVKQGESPTWNLLTNDPPNGAGAYTIVSTSQPDKGTVSISGSNSVTFTPKPDTSGATSFTYTIEDPAGRQAQATVRTSVEDRPATPSQPTVGEQLSRTAVVSFARPDDRGSPIDSFEVRSAKGVTACTGSPCTVSSLDNGVEYTFAVRAHNGVGWSEWSTESAPYTPDELPGTPPTPQADWNDKSATVTWGAVPNQGSALIDVTVTVSPADATPIVYSGGQSGGTVTFNGLKNGTAYTFTFVARNKKGVSPISPQSASVVPAGLPQFSGAPVLVADNGFVTVTWTTADGNGDDNLTYKVKLQDLAASTTTTSVGATLTATLPAVNGHTYRAVINVANKYTTRYSPAGVDSQQSNSDTAIGIPTAPSVTATVGAGNGAINLSWTGADLAGGTLTRYEVSVNNGTWETAGTGTTSVRSAGLTLGQSYTFRVRAINNNRSGTPGAASAPSNAASPYTPPAQPAANCSANSGYTITCSWSIGALNGPGSPSVSVTGMTNSGATSGSATTGVLGYNTSAGINVQVCNGGTAGNNCSSNSTSTSTGDHRSVSSSRGSSYGTCDVGGGTCYYVTLSISGFLPGGHTFTCFGGQTVAGKTWAGTINADGAGNGSISTSNTSPYCVAANSGAADMVVEGIGASGSW